MYLPAAGGWLTTDRPSVVCACQYETEPGLVGAYIQFLAAHGSGDPLPELTETVVDLAQLLVERSTIVAALLPTEPGRADGDYVTLRALLHIFNTYMQQVGGRRRRAARLDRSQEGCFAGLVDLKLLMTPLKPR